MIITKAVLSRRTLLRGAGATLALPFLDAMIPALSAAAKPVPRFGVFYVPNGMYMPNFVPKGEGMSFEFSPILSPLEPFRDQLVAVSGLANLQAEAMDVGGATHTRCHAAWLSGCRPKRTEGGDIQAGTTLDQIAAKELGKDAQLLSLELALEPSYVVGNCEAGYSCVYVNSSSWRTPTMPLPMENNPRAVFERLFGDGTSGPARLEQLRANRSILDWVTEEITSLQHTLGQGDRATVSEYLDAVRDVEQRIQRAERDADTSPTALAAPIGIPASFEEHATLMFDLQFLAYQADITRVATFQIGREQSARSYPQLGVDGAHHEISHFGKDPDKIAQNTKINAYHVQLFAHLVEKMRSTPDGDGSLLDHALFLYGCGMGDGQDHSPHNVPVLLVGGGCGQLRGGRHLTPTVDTPFMNVGLSLLHKLGVAVDSVGDSTGPLGDL